MKTLRHGARARVAAVGIAAGVLLAGCGAANESAPAGGSSGGASSGAGALNGTISGAGSSAQQAAMQAWIAGFTGANPGATVNYDPAGSGAGRTQFISGGVAFAGRDACLKPDELTQAQARCKGDVVEVPAYVSPIAVVYNLPGVTDLQLAPATVAGIFLGKITQWNAPEIAADNPGETLPDQAITPVHRSDDSGTTQNFTDYLNKAAPDVWTKAAGTWPVQGGEAAQGTSGVVGAVQGGNGTIGYADESQAGSLGKALIKVGDAYAGPTPEAAANVAGRVQARRGSWGERLRVRPQPRHDGRRHLPDRPGVLPDRLLQVRGPGPGRPREGLPDLHDQRRRPAGRRAGRGFGAAERRPRSQITPAVTGIRSAPDGGRSGPGQSRDLPGPGAAGDRPGAGPPHTTDPPTRSGPMSATTTDAPAPASSRPVQQPGDRIFVNLARGAGIAHPRRRSAGVAVFLIAEAAPAVDATRVGAARRPQPVRLHRPARLRDHSAAAIALIVATPLAVAVALFISHFAPPRLAQTLGYLVDLLAAVPSLIYGLWGASVLGPARWAWPPGSTSGSAGCRSSLVPSPQPGAPC